MIGLELAQALRAAGLAWEPVAGDCFAVPERDLDDEVFVVSDLVVEVRDIGRERHLSFNGTTEWALDSLEVDEAVWLPREDQLRDLLGAAFEQLEQVTQPVPAYVVRSGGAAYVGVSAAEAYARAVLAGLPPTSDG